MGGYDAFTARQIVTGLLDCHRSCEETIAHCLHTGGEHADPAHIRLMSDCAQICSTTADFLIRGSAFGGQIAALCAHICDRCEQACAAFPDDAEMSRCAEACRQCAQQCRALTTVTV